MGDVYEVGHARLAGRYALKLMAKQAAGDGEALQRFQREAAIVSSLRHPHIVQVIDFDQTPDGRPYLVMELLVGEDLHTRLRRLGPLPLSRVVAIVKQIASALAAAHRRGVVHRDLKPENVLLVTVEGEEDGDYVKLVDFGVSKVKSASLRLTKGGAMMGTPHYMAPEQAQGASDVDEKVDQFALAAIAYELLSGEVAFAGSDIATVVYQVVFGQPPRLVDAGGLVNAAVDAVIKKALSKAAADRFASVAEFAKAFEKAARSVRGSGAAVSRLSLPTVGAGPETRPTAVTVGAPAAAMALAGSSATTKIVVMVALTAAVAGTIWASVLRNRPPRPVPVAPVKAAAPVQAPAPPINIPAPPPSEIRPAAPAPPPLDVEKAAAPAAPEAPDDVPPRPTKPTRGRHNAPPAEERLYNDL
ncbi:MAG: eukaryotic-like serine/threonine-protein kinase [Myxococcales bacterium]|nr:eukaryotic-like serine/threonine-protein kinase [Myxococcales bacterium]